MQAPKRKTSKSKRNMRRAHHALVPIYSTVCPQCKALIRRYHVCSECGNYRGRKILEMPLGE